MLPLTLRVLAVRVLGSRNGTAPSPRQRRHARRRLRRLPNEVLLFDVETEGVAQRVLVAGWRLYRDPHGAPAAMTLVEEGLFYRDTLPMSDPARFAELLRYVETHEAATAPGFGRRLVLMPERQWLKDRLFRYGYKHRDRCTVAGFNIGFDLGACARYWAPAEGYYRGGWSLGFWGEFDQAGKWHDRRYHPRLLEKSIDPRRTLFGWGSLKRGDEDEVDVPANIVDLRTLSFALTDRSLTLEGACTIFGDPYQKADVTYGLLDERMLDYARDDVAHTAELYRRCLADVARHPGIDLQPARLYSPATVGTRYLETMGLRRPLWAFTHLDPAQLGWTDTGPGERSDRPLDPRVIGWGTSAFFGGRAEGRIARTVVPVAVLDAVSMYPLVNANLGTWSLLTAEHLEARDVTEEVRAVLAAPDLLERCLTREFWLATLGVTLVELDHPAGLILPARAAYDPESPDPGIGVNPLTYDGTLWNMLPDVVANVILGGPAPVVRRAIRLVGVGQQPGLQSVALRGGTWIDPRADDPFVAMIAERHRVAHSDLPEEEHQRLDRFLKVTTNASGFGVLARFDRRELAEPVPVLVYGPDDEPFRWETANPEDPGPYAFPPIAAAITAGARLMLALLERLVTDAGGAYAFCDTDSMAIVAARRRRVVECDTRDGDTVTALSFDEVEAIVARFAALKPSEWTLVQSVWKAEHDSLWRPLWCRATSAKRYVLFRQSPDASPDLVDVVDLGEEEEVDGGE